MNIIAAVTPEIDGKLWIGKDNELLYHDEYDMEVFKRHTLYNAVVMGRSTYDSIGHPLKDRLNIVITRDQNLLDATGYKRNEELDTKHMQKVVDFMNQLSYTNITSENDNRPKEPLILFVLPEDLFEILLYIQANVLLIFTTYLIGGTKTFETFLKYPVVDMVLLDEFITKPKDTPNKEFPMRVKELGNLVEVQPVGLCGNFMTRHYEFEERKNVIKSYLSSNGDKTWRHDLIDKFKKTLDDKDYIEAYSLFISVVSLMMNYDSNRLRTYGKILEISEDSVNHVIESSNAFAVGSNIYEDMRVIIAKHFSISDNE